MIGLREQPSDPYRRNPLLHPIPMIPGPPAIWAKFYSNAGACNWLPQDQGTARPGIHRACGWDLQALR